MNISSKQRSVLKVLKQGGFIVSMPRSKARLLDDKNNPLQYVHRRTFRAMLRKQLITKTSNGTFSSIGVDKK